MYKELVICLVTIIVIIFIDNLSGNYTKESVAIINEELTGLKNEISEENMEDENLHNKADKIYENWRQRYNILAYYLEHDELEKVEKNIVGLKSAIYAKEYPEAISEIDESEFVLSHIQEKNSFDLKNIF